MRIAFDGSTLQPRRTGVGYYTEHLLQHLASALAAGDTLTVVSNRTPVTTHPLPSHVRVATAARPMARQLWLQAEAPGLLRRIDADIAHFTNGMRPVLSRVPSVVTIHDASLTRHPEYHPRRRRLINRPLVGIAARTAAAIVTPSASARQDIIDAYGLDARRVHVVHEAAAPAFRRVTGDDALGDARARLALPDRFFLYVGAIEPRKNLPRLLEAFAALRAAGLPHHLVCAGPYGWLSRDIDGRVAALGLGAAVRFIGYVPYDDLPALYSLAECFVFPSIYEGFGLPVMEAMACGAPVIASDIDALREIGGNAVRLVPPHDARALAAAMIRLAESPTERADLAGAGLERAATFSWRRAAAETLEVYDHAARAGAPAHTRTSAPARAHARTGAPAHASGIDVLLGQSYFLRFDPKLWRAQQPYPPLGTLYAAAALRRDGQRVSVFDAMLAQSEDEWATALDRERPAVAVLYEDSFNYLSKMCLLRMRDAALTMIDAAVTRGIPIVIAGSDATDHPAIYLRRGAACVVRGEGEVTLLAVVAALSAGQPIDGIAGLSRLDRGGQVVHSASRPFIRSLDDLPRPAWDLIDIARYRRTWISRHGYFSMNVATTRGCPYGCNWCAKPIYGQRYTVRSAANVAAEVTHLARTYRPDHLWITDDIFGLKPGWIAEYAAALERDGTAVPFKCLMRADQVTPDVVAALSRGRCRTVWLGAESGSQRVLDAMDKGITVADIECATALLRRSGIEVGLFLQFGYPGETREDIAATEAMVARCRPDDIGISISYPLPGTPFFDRVRAELGAKQNWVDSDDLAAMYRTTYPPGFYRVLHRAVHAAFKVRRAAVLARAMSRPWTIRPRHLRQAAGAVWAASTLPFLRRTLTRLARTPQGPPTSSPPSGSMVTLGADAVPEAQDA